MNLNYQLRHEIKSLNYLMDHILYQIFKITLNISYFEYITDNPSIIIYLDEMQNRIIFKIKTEYYLELLTPELMKLLASTKSKIAKDKNDENVPHLEVTEVALVHCNIVSNNYQQDLRVLYAFVPNKSFGQLLDISPKNVTFLKTSGLEFSYIELWFTDQTSKPLEIEDKINITLVIN